MIRQNSNYNKNMMVNQRNSSLLPPGSKRGDYGSNYRVSQHLNKPKVVNIKVEDLDINKVIDADKAISRLGDVALYRLMLP